MKKSLNIDFSEVAGVAVGAIAPNLLNRFGAPVLNKLPNGMRPFIPAAIGLGLVYFGNKNKFLKATGIGMVGGAAANLARTQFGIGATDDDFIGAVEQVTGPILLQNNPDLFPLAGNDNQDEIGNLDDYGMDGLDNQDEIGNLDDYGMEGVFESYPIEPQS